MGSFLGTVQCAACLGLACSSQSLAGFPGWSLCRHPAVISLSRHELKLLFSCRCRRSRSLPRLAIQPLIAISIVLRYTLIQPALLSSRASIVLIHSTLHHVQRPGRHSLWQFPCALTTTRVRSSFQTMLTTNRTSVVTRHCPSAMYVVAHTAPRC